MKERFAIELDGEQHADEENVKYDEERTARLNELGVRVMRFWDYDALRDTEVVAEMIWRALTTGEEPSPQPSPGVPGEGERATDAQQHEGI